MEHLVADDNDRPDDTADSDDATDANAATDADEAPGADPDDVVDQRLDGRLDDRFYRNLIGNSAKGRWGADGHDPNLEVAAPPVRYPRAPLIALVIVALVPALALTGLARWAGTEADKFDESREAVARLDRASSNGATQTDVGDRVKATLLTTKLFDYRRTPVAVASVASAAQLRSAVEPVLRFIGAQSCAAISINGITVTSVNPDLPVVPASNQKLLVAAAALEILGPDFTFTTSVAAQPPVDGTVEGDIYLIGGGDPLLTSGDFFLEGDPLAVLAPTPFEVLADALVEAGVTRIRGTVIGDGTRYDDEFVVDEWAEGVAFNDAGPYDALMANDARVGGRSGREDDPNSGAAREFVRLLNQRNIRVDNGYGSGVASNLVPIVANVESAPLSDVIAEMLLTSDNNTAEMLLKELGVAASGQGTRAAGLDAMMAALSSIGVPTEGVAPRDGSGLSNANRVTCAAMLEVVQWAAGGPIDAGLPTAAVSGTLATEFVDTAMAGRLRAKTGTLANLPFEIDPPAVKALAGYVDPLEDSRAGTIEFVLIANTPNIADPTIYQGLWREFGDRLATYPAEPVRDSLGPR